jgi:cell division protein FtsQ
LAVLRWPWRRGNRRLRKSPATPAGQKAGRRADWRASLSLLGRLAAALLLAGLIGGALYGSRYFVYHSPRFALRELRIVGAQRVGRAAIERRVAISLGRNLIEIDTRAVEARLLAEPWVKSVAVRRELPATLRIELLEHQPAALVALESLYLCDRDGVVFKRALGPDSVGLPVVTGVGRTTYVLDPTGARSQIVAALSALALYQRQPTRPPIGEVHIDRFVGATLFTRQGLAIQLGRPNPDAKDELDQRLDRFDAVWRSLREGPSRPVMVFLDNRVHPDHVTVRLAPAN